jgi:serine phosphatase RsbU (regulator of sigma subunit)
VLDQKRRVGASELTPTGPLISSVTGGWTLGRRSFGVDDLLVVCTDGVTDARDGEGRELGSDGLLDVLAGLRSWSPHEVVAESLAAVRRFAVDVHRDDVTVVALRAVPSPP